MPDKFRNKYRIPSSRLPDWDYRWAGAYFVTLCTKDRRHDFGEIVDGQMELLGIGMVADVLWHEIKHHAPEVELDAFVVMPNHVHGILVLPGIGAVDDDAQPESPSAPATTPKNETMAGISPKPGSLSTIIRSYKSAVTKHAHRLGFEFEWQTRFYEHIIRDETAWHTIRQYIANNPTNWKEDKFYE